MTTMTHTIKCGNCKGTHNTPAEVRACYATAQAAAILAGPLDPKPTTVVVSGQQPLATAKQLAYIERLRQERGLETTVNYLATLTKKEASDAIETLLATPKAAPAQHPDAQPKDVTFTAPEGMHKVGDEIFKVQRAVHGSGHLYCKRLIPGEGYGAKATFVYAPGFMKNLSAATKMTLEEAKAFGALYGTCCVCGRTLTNEESIAAGIGPICAGKGEWA